MKKMKLTKKSDASWTNSSLRIPAKWAIIDDTGAVLANVKQEYAGWWVARDNEGKEIVDARNRKQCVVLAMDKLGGDYFAQ